MIAFRNFMANCQPIFYKLYEGQEEILDEYRNPTGSPRLIYGDLKSAYLCISPNKGDASIEPFGALTDYDRTMTTADTECPIAEDSILWIDGADTKEPYNYYVKKRAPWKNSIAFAIKEVKVRE